jgi:hypothetical protein
MWFAFGRLRDGVARETARAVPHVARLALIHRSRFGRTEQLTEEHMRTSSVSRKALSCARCFASCL